MDLASSSFNISPAPRARRTLRIPVQSEEPVIFQSEALPAGLTILGPAFSEANLIRFVYDLEQTTHHCQDPALFPALC
jgi:Asp-tRNA(Asn)/Glu-tRNA(Gln) amidotransferase A subunit family amidase